MHVKNQLEKAGLPLTILAGARSGWTTYEEAISVAVILQSKNVAGFS